MTVSRVKIKLVVTVESEHARKVPTRADINRVFSPIVQDYTKQAKRILDKDLQSKFSRKNRAKLIKKTGRGKIPGMPGMNGIWSMTGTNEGSTPLRWLEEGTSVRWRGMSPDFVSKTRPYAGTKTRAGRGRAINFWAPHHGIKPRLFRDGIMIVLADPFYVDVNKGIDRLWNMYLR